MTITTKRLPNAIFAVMLLQYIFVSNASAADLKIIPPPTKISEHVYAWIGPLGPPSKENQGYRMNMVVVVGNNAAAILDTGYTGAMANEMLQHIRNITKVPVKYAINTNSQAHRIMGNGVFSEAGAIIIAHKDSAARMERMGSNFVTAIENILEIKDKSIQLPKLPDQIIDKPLSLDLGGVSIHLKNYGPTHVSAQLVAEIPEDKIVYASDLLCSERMLGVLPDGNVKNWIASFDKLASYGDVTFIPGHGKPAPLKEFEFPTRQYLQLLFDHMMKMIEEGVDVQDAINKLDQSQYSKLANYEELAGRNASWAYLELEAASFE